MMNAAAGLIGGSPLQLAQQPADPAAPDATAGEPDFTAALAAACAGEPEARSALAAADSTADPVTEASEAAAMLALAGLVKLDIRHMEPTAPDTFLPQTTDDTQVAVGILAEQAVVRSAAIDTAADGADAVPESPGVVADEVAATRPLVLMRAQEASEPRGTVSVPVAEIAAAAAEAVDVPSAATAESGMARRFIGELLERASSHVRAADPDSEVHSTSGTTLYANTRETLVTAAGHTGNPDVVRSPVGSPRWATEVGSRLVLMSMRGQQEGSLSLTPEHLGPLEVRINVSQDGTNVWFGAQHADTRAALTDALPRLREMFAASGLALGQAGVSHEMPRHEARHSDLPFTAGAASEAATEHVLATPARRLSLTLLDAWA